MRSPAADTPPRRWHTGRVSDATKPTRYITCVLCEASCGLEVVTDGLVLDRDGVPVGPAAPADLAWLQKWREGDSGVVGRRRDEVWRTLTSRVVVGEAIAVDYAGGGPVGHWRGRRHDARLGVDISAGVEFRSCRAATGGRLVPQHRILAELEPQDVQGAAELAVLRDRAGLGAFQWLITDRA